MRNAAGLGFQPYTAQPLGGTFAEQLIAGSGGHLAGRNSRQSWLSSPGEVLLQQVTGGGQCAPATGQLLTGYGAHRALSAPGGTGVSPSGRGHLGHCAQPTHLRNSHD